MTKPLPIITNVFRTTLNWQITGGPAAHTVMHFNCATGGTAAVFAALSTNVTSTMWMAQIGTCLITSVSILPLDGIAATVIYSTGSGTKWGGPQVGDYVVAPSVLVKLTTGARGPSHRGRAFLPYPAEAAIANGALSGSTQGSMQTAWNTFYTAMSSAAVIPVVASYKHSTATNVQSYFVENLLGSQRRRQSRLRKV